MNRKKFYIEKYPELTNWLIKYFETESITTFDISRKFNVSSATIGNIANTYGLRKTRGRRISTFDYTLFNTRQKKTLFNYFVNGNADIRDLLKFPEFENNNFNQISTFIKNTTGEETKKEIGII